MDTTLTIRIPVETAQRLNDLKAKSFINISAFVRQAIEREFQRSVGPENATEKLANIERRSPAVLIGK